MATTYSQKQVNIRLDPALYRALEAIARQERRSVPQTARLLIEESLQKRIGQRSPEADTPGQAIAPLARAGGATAAGRRWREERAWEDPGVYVREGAEEGGARSLITVRALAPTPVEMTVGGVNT